MNIREIMYNRACYLDQSSIVEIDVYGNNIEDGKLLIGDASHIFLKNIHDDENMVISLVVNTLANKYGGISFYINEIYDDMIGKIKQMWENTEKCPSVTGLTIQHIQDTGYIISSTCTFDSIMVNEYALAEYLKKMEEYIIVAIAKQEKHYIKDWVAYHLRIGFDRIYLFDNNDDDERYDEILKEYIDDGRVILKDVRGKKGLQNPIYNASYHSLPFKWMAVIDIDEFIWFNETGQYNDVKSWLQDMCGNRDRCGIMLQWHCYAPSGDDKPSDKPIWEANSKLLPFNSRKDCRCEFIHGWCKSIYKRGYQLTINEHFSWGPNECCMEVGWDDKPLLKVNLLYITEEEFKNQGVFIKHFILRNIDDFYRNKYMRGHAGADFGKGDDGWKFYQWRQNINYFTDSVGTLTEKEQIYLAKKGMKMNYTFHPDVFVNLYMADGHDHINAGITSRILSSQLLPMSNTFLTKIHMCVSNVIKQPSDDTMLTMDKISDYDLSFLTMDLFSNYYMDVLMDGEERKVRKFIQEPVIINIGIPARFVAQEISIEEQKHYLDFLSILFTQYNLKQSIRAALEYNVTTIPSIGVSNENDYIGKNGELDEFLSNIGLKIPNSILFNNTMIMSWQQWLKFKKFHSEFTKRFGYTGASNNEICENIISGQPDKYQLYTHSILSVIDNPYYVWPA